MKKIILFIYLFLNLNFQALSKEPILQELIKGLDSPWSLSFINDNLVIVTEKSGNLILVNFNNKNVKKIKKQKNTNSKVKTDPNSPFAVLEKLL